MSFLKHRLCLLGGMPKDSARAFPPSLIKKGDLGPSPEVLVLPFAREETDWPSVFHKYRETLGGADIRKENIHLATRDLLTSSHFPWSLVAVCGGQTSFLLKEKAILLPFLKKALNDCCVFATSAGAHFLSTNYWDWKSHSYQRGGEVLALNVVTHAEQDPKCPPPQVDMNFPLIKLLSGEAFWQ